MFRKDTFKYQLPSILRINTKYEQYDFHFAANIMSLWVGVARRGLGYASRERLPFRKPGSVPFLGLACAPIVETRFLEFVRSLIDFSPWIPIGTFSILLIMFFFFLNDCIYKKGFLKHKGRGQEHNIIDLSFIWKDFIGFIAPPTRFGQSRRSIGVTYWP